MIKYLQQCITNFYALRKLHDIKNIKIINIINIIDTFTNMIYSFVNSNNKQLRKIILKDDKQININ